MLLFWRINYSCSHGVLVYAAWVLIKLLSLQPSPELRGAVKEQLQLLQALLGRGAGVALHKRWALLF